MSPALLFVVDDDPSVLNSLSRMLRILGHDVEAFASPRQFLQRPRHPGPACLISDLQMPEMSGLEFQQALLAEGHTLPIIFLTGHGDIPTTVKALKAGAVDFLTKPVASEKLLGSVNTAIQGHRARLQQMDALQDLQRRFDRLTPREKQVCVRVGRGLLNKQIAYELSTAEKTVKLHRSRVMKKMQISSVAELVDLLRALGTR